jgi:hypothetical protein
MTVISHYKPKVEASPSRAAMRSDALRCVMIALVPVLAIILGVLLYVVPASPKLAELGRILYAAGVLVLLYSLAGHTVSILR